MVAPKPEEGEKMSQQLEINIRAVDNASRVVVEASKTVSSSMREVEAANRRVVEVNREVSASSREIALHVESERAQLAVASAQQLESRRSGLLN